MPKFVSPCKTDPFICSHHSHRHPKLAHPANSWPIPRSQNSKKVHNFAQSHSTKIRKIVEPVTPVTRRQVPERTHLRCSENSRMPLKLHDLLNTDRDGQSGRGETHLHVLRVAARPWVVHRRPFPANSPARLPRPPASQTKGGTYRKLASFRSPDFTLAEVSPTRGRSVIRRRSG